MGSLIAIDRIVLRKCRKLKDSGYPNYRELNAFLLKEYSKVNDGLIKLEQAGKSYSVNELHSKSTNKPSPTTLYKFAESIIDKLTKSGRIVYNTQELLLI